MKYFIVKVVFCFFFLIQRLLQNNNQICARMHLCSLKFPFPASKITLIPGREHIQLCEWSSQVKPPPSSTPSLSWPNDTIVPYQRGRQAGMSPNGSKPVAASSRLRCKAVFSDVIHTLSLLFEAFVACFPFLRGKSGPSGKTGIKQACHFFS